MYNVKVEVVFALFYLRRIIFDNFFFFAKKKNSESCALRQHYTLNPIILADYWLDSVCSLCRWSRLTLSLPCLVRLHIYIINYITLLIIIFTPSRALLTHTRMRTTRDTTRSNTRDKRAIKRKRKKKEKKKRRTCISEKTMYFCPEENLKYFCSISVNIVRDLSNNTAHTRTNTHERRIFLTHDCLTFEVYVIP